MRLFKIKEQTQEQEVVETKRSSAEIVAEIHDTFFTEVDRIFEEARVLNSIEKDESLVDKAVRLSNLGFNKSKDTFKSLFLIPHSQVFEEA